MPGGFEPKILEVLAEALGVSLNISHINWGWYDAEGNWNGQFGMVSILRVGLIFWVFIEIDKKRFS